MTLEQVRAALGTLPIDRTPRAADWRRLSSSWRLELDERMGELERLRDTLTSCIGCGCLSLRTCRLFNADDAVAARGPGPRILYPGGLPEDRD